MRMEQHILIKYAKRIQLTDCGYCLNEAQIFLKGLIQEHEQSKVNNDARERTNKRKTR